jgi:hypothetical protein
MDVPTDAEVLCSDGPAGRTTGVILDPVTRRVTHLVVKADRIPHSEYLMPLELVIETASHTVSVRCTEVELHQLEPFVETEFAPPEEAAFPMYEYEDYRFWPYITPESALPFEVEHIPPGKLVMRRGTRVWAIDGLVGHIDGLLIDPTDGYITHLVLREDHLWAHRDITIPISQIGQIEEEGVRLKMTKAAIERLPTIPVSRR